MRRETFHSGRAYAAAIDWPWYVPEGAARSALTEEGWKILSLDDCEGLVVPYDLPAGCGDHWDTWGVALRTGPTYSRDVPDEFVHVLDLTGEGEGYPPAPPFPPPGNSTECDKALAQAHQATQAAWWNGVAVGAGGVAIVGLVGLGLGYLVTR